MTNHLIYYLSKINSSKLIAKDNFNEWKELTKILLYTYPASKFFDELSEIVFNKTQLDTIKYPFEKVKKQVEKGVISEEMQKINGRIKIIDIAKKKYGLDIKKGNKCICPFHKDIDPSLSFNNAKGLFYCFGCHVGGDTIKFIGMMEDLRNEKK